MKLQITLPTDWLSKSEKAVQISGALTDEAVRNGSIKKVKKKEMCGNLARIGVDYRGVPRNVNPVNARNPTVGAYYECGSTDHARSACLRLNRAQGPEENHPNQVAANNGGQGMDWLSNYKAEIICHEKVVTIPLPDGKVLRVFGERPEEKAGFLMGAKAGDKKQEEIIVVRDFPEVFPDDLSGLLPIREIEFRIELTPGATQVAKSPYHLAPCELEELLGKLKELQDKVEQVDC
ncbi:hypothetical protein Tco_0935190 [Tanacetum coccineum]